jgi:hypothetical protein
MDEMSYIELLIVHSHDHKHHFCLFSVLNSGSHTCEETLLLELCPEP